MRSSRRRSRRQGAIWRLDSFGFATSPGKLTGAADRQAFIPNQQRETAVLTARELFNSQRRDLSYASLAATA